MSTHSELLNKESKALTINSKEFANENVYG